MKAIIIDDEPRARNLLQKMLAEINNISLEVFTAKNLLEGVKLIEKEQPKIVFLDIELPEHSGLEIFNFIKTPVTFKLIFTTAYNQYAIEAFKQNAVDYLLKPIDINELEQAVLKAKNLLDNEQLTNQIEDLSKALQKIAINKIALEVPKGILFVAHEDILYFEADGMYTNVFLKDGDKKLICKPLKIFVEQLQEEDLFFKCHRSYLVNLQYVVEFSRKDGDQLIMSNQKSVPISKSNKENFLKVVQQIFG